MMPPSSPHIQEQMRAFYRSLSEKDRRRYAAVEAQKIGYGGGSYIARVLGSDRHTVARGVQELTDRDALLERRSCVIRLRRAGS